MRHIRSAGKRLAAYWQRQLWLRDGLFTLVVTWTLSGFGQAQTISDGLLFPVNHHLALTFSLLLGLPLLIRRTRPELAAKLFASLCFSQILLGPTLLISDAIGLIMIYSVLVYGKRSTSRVFVLIASGLTLLDAVVFTLVSTLGSLSQLTASTNHPCSAVLNGKALTTCSSKLLFTLLGVLLSFGLVLSLVIFVAFWNRSRRQALTAMRQRNEAILYQQEEEATLAASAERARIARDMHDLVAHTLSIVIVQSDAGRYAGTEDTNLALQVMTTIRHEANKALNDMNQLFGSLTGPVSSSGRPALNPTPAHERSQAPVEGLTGTSTASNITPAVKTSCEDTSVDQHDYRAIDDLVRQARQACPDLQLVRSFQGTPEPGELSAQASLVAYRCVQEALSNIRKHAGPRARAHIVETWSAQGLRMVISDKSRGAAMNLESANHTGYGLLGMQERLKAIGGQMQAGPSLEGGFRVDVTIPLAGCAEPTTVSSKLPQATPTHAQTPAHNNLPAWHTAASPSRAADSSEEDEPAPNRIERLSNWSAQHYLLVDAVVLVPLLLLLTVSDSTFFTLDTNINDVSSKVPLPVAALESLALALPIAFRRHWPNLSAAVVASIAALELFAVPWIGSVNILVLVCLYSVMAYGRGKARVWVPMSVLAELLLMAVRLHAEISDGSPTLLAWCLGQRPGFSNQDIHGSPQETLKIVLAATAISCACAMVLGLWRRASGSSILLQREREEALRQGQAQSRQLAANAERARIGTQIQAQVAATLGQVIAGADAGIAMIEVESAAGEGPSPAEVDQAFEAIGREGRIALTRMRQLLDILRQTGSSDSSSPAEPSSPALQLHPVDLAR